MNKLSTRPSFNRLKKELDLIRGKSNWIFGFCPILANFGPASLPAGNFLHETHCTQGMLNLLFVISLSAPVVWASGRIAKAIRLPVITGYLIAGILAGPYALLSVSSSDRQVLSLVEQMSIALIAVAAGAELQVAELKRTRKQVRLCSASSSPHLSCKSQPTPCTYILRYMWNIQD